MDKACNTTPEKRTKEFKGNRYGNKNEKDDRLTRMMCKSLSRQSAPNVEIDMFDRNLLEFNYFISIFNMVEQG